MAELEPDLRPFLLGDWSVLPDRNRLIQRRLRGRKEKTLTPLETRLLLRLVKEPGTVVPKAALMRDVWNGAAVVDHVLPKTLSKLRASLEDDARNPRYIETVERRGYRLLLKPSPAPMPALGRRLPSPRLGWSRALAAAAALALFFSGWLVRGTPEATKLDFAVAVPEATPPVQHVRAPLRVVVPLPATDETSGEPLPERYLFDFKIATR